MPKFVIARIPGTHTDFRTSNPIPNLGVGFLSAVARRAGYKTAVLEGHMWLDMGYLPSDMSYPDRLKFFLKEVEAENPDILGISALSSDLALCIEFAKLYKSKYPGTVIILGGMGVNGVAEIIARYAGDSIDIIVKGEGEYTLKEILGELKKGSRKNFSKIKGISYQTMGRWCHNSERELITDLDIIPIMGLEDYKYLPPNIITLLPVERGCPSACRFCFATKTWGTGRYFSKERIKEQGKILLQFQKTLKRLYLSDSNIMAKEDEGENTLRFILKHFSEAVGSVNIRIDQVTLPLVKLFSKHPRVSPLFGIESLSPKLLLYLGKTRSPRQYLNRTDIILNSLKEHRTKYSLSFIYHIPGETDKDLLKLYNFFQEQDPSKCTLIYFSRLWLEGKTQFWDDYKKGKIDIFPIYKPHSAVLGGQYEDPVFEPFFYSIKNQQISEEQYEYFSHACRQMFFNTNCIFLG